MAHLSTRSKLLKRFLNLMFLAVFLFGSWNSMNILNYNYYSLKDDNNSQSFNIDEQENNVFKNPNLASANNTEINNTYRGFGGNIPYDIQALGEGNVSEWVDLRAPLENRSTVMLGAPNNSVVTWLNITLDSMELHNTTTFVGNDSLTYSPTYTILYTNNSISVLNQSNWVNLTITDFSGARVGDINLSIDGVQNLTWNGAGIHNVALNFTNNGTYNITLEMYYTNSTLFANETFLVHHLNETASDGIPITKESTLLNPYLRLNDNTSYNTLAINFTVYEPSNISSFAIFGEYDLFYNYLVQYKVQVQIWNASNSSLNAQPGTNKLMDTLFPTLIYDNFQPNWIFFDLSNESVQLDPGQYFFVINASNVVDSNGCYFDWYKSNDPDDGSQNPWAWNETSNQWEEVQGNFLFNYTLEYYRPTNLTETQVNATLINTEGNTTTSTFDPSTNRTIFTLSMGGPWPTNNPPWYLPVSFNSNYSIRFNFTFQMQVNQSLQTDLPDFKAYFNETFTHWHIDIETQAPTTSENATIKTDFSLHPYNYTISFPSTWKQINGTSSNGDKIGPKTGLITVNESVSTYNWSFIAISDFAQMELNTQNNDMEVTRGEILTCVGYFNSSIYNVSLSLWDATFRENSSVSDIGFNVLSAIYLNYTDNVSYTIANQSLTRTTIFKDYSVPDNYSSPYITARIWWHNYTEVGILLFNITVKQSASLSVEKNEYDMKVNTTLGITISYRDDENNSVNNANITTDWVSGQWSVSYDSLSGNYILTLDSTNMTAGTFRDVQINVSHEQYSNRQLTIKVYLLINTTLNLISGKTTLYFNETINVELAWYTSTGEKIITDQYDTNYLINITLDNEPISLFQYNFDYNKEYPNSNIFIKIPTSEFEWKNYIGTHVLKIQTEKQNDTVHYENQLYLFYFNVQPVPGYLSFNTTNAPFTQNTISTNGEKEIIISAFEKTSDLLDVRVNYWMNATYSNQLNKMVLFRWANVWVEIIDNIAGNNIKPITACENLIDGSYRILINITEFSSSTDYTIHFFSNSTNMAPTEISIKLKIIPKWHAKLDLNSIDSAMENKEIKIEGTLFFENSTDKWIDSTVKIYIQIDYYGNNQNYTELLVVYTDDTGHFESKSLIMPSVDNSTIVNITTWIESTIAWDGTKETIEFDIQPNQWERIGKPIVISIVVILASLIALIKIGIPVIKKKIPSTDWYYKFTKSDLGQKIIPKLHLPGEKEIIEAIEAKKAKKIILHVPRFRLPDDKITVGVPEPEPPVDEIIFDPRKEQLLNPPKRSTGITKILRTSVTQIIQEFQEIFEQTNDPSLLAIKRDDALYKALLLEKRGETFKAIVNLYFAQQFARKLGHMKEVDSLENRINQLLLKLDSKEQIKFIRKYRLPLEKKLKK